MLSLSMIVRNEAERLERCLGSVAGFVDEMVLLDTGSTDATIAIAEACGAVVHQLPWPGDFAPARNAALQHVRGDWVLVLDADEWLLPEAREPLRQLMAQPDLLLINLLREERGSAQSPYSNVSRLFRRHPAIHWSRPYHSMVDDSVLALLEQEPHWRLADCDVPALAHDGYRPELLASGAKAERLRQAMEADLAAHPGDPYACAKLGSLEVSEGNRERGIALLEQGLAHCPPYRYPERYELLLHLAIARTSGSQHPDDYECLSLHAERLALVAAPQHPQQDNPTLNLTDLSAYSWVVYPTGTPMRTVLEREFGEAGLEFPRYPLETSSTFTMLSLLQEDPQLVAVMPHSIACSSEGFGLLRRLPLELQARNEPCSIIHRRGSSLSPLASLLLEHLRSEQQALT